MRPLNWESVDGMELKEDAKKLKILADWFDKEQETGRWPKTSTEVQKDLRRMSNFLERLGEIKLKENWEPPEG